MRSILKLTYANIRHGRGSFKGIALLMMLIVFSFTGTISNCDDLDAAIVEGFDYAECGDIEIDIMTELLTDEMRECVDSHSQIERAVYREHITVNQKPLVDNEEKKIAIELVKDDGRTRVFNSDFTAFETGDTAPRANEIYLPYKMKTLVDNGADITIKASDGEEITLRVKGFYEDPVYGATTVSSNYCVISSETFEHIAQKTDRLTDDRQSLRSRTDVRIYVKDGVSADELKKQLNDDCGIIDACLYSPTRQDLIDNVTMYSNVGARIVAVYVGLLLLVVMIIMYNSISSATEMYYTDLGILKAQGFTQWQIRLAFILQYTAAIIIGAIPGLIISYPVCGALIRLFMNMTGMLTSTDISLGKCAALSVGMIIVCAVFVTAATAKIGKISPVRAISGSRGEEHSGGRLRTPIKQKPLTLFLALRQLTSGLRHYIGTALIMTMMIFFLVSITVLANGLDADTIFKGLEGDITVTDLGGFKLSNTKDIEQALHSIDPDAYLSTESYRRMNVEGQQYSVHTFGREEDRFKPTKGRAPENDSEVLITESVSRSTGKEIGDTIHIKYLGHTKEFVVTGYFQTVWEYGVMVMPTAEGLQKLGFEDVISSSITLSDKDKADEVTAMLNDRFGGFLKAEKTAANDTVEAYKKLINFLLDIVAYVIYGMSVLFAAVVIFMVTKAAFLRERTDIGIYKSLGLTSGVLRMQFSLRFLLIALVGAAAGSLCAMLCTAPMLGFMMRAVGLSDFATDFDALTFLVPAVFICAGTFICSYIASYRVKSVEVRELVSE